jgi:DNA-binding NarL/FixJ family response regulator
MSESFSIIFCEDKKIFRDGVIEALQEFDVKVLAEAENGRELLKLLTCYKPDVVLLDLEMPVMNGSEALEVIVKKFPDTRVIILSLYYEEALQENFLVRGARGYVPKDAVAGNIELLIEAIRMVKSGRIFKFDFPCEKRNYSRRQKELMPLIFDGYTNEEIAEKMGINKRSVEKHRQKLYEKAGVKRSIDFYKYAFAKGFQFLGSAIGKLK